MVILHRINFSGYQQGKTAHSLATKNIQYLNDR